MKTVTALLIMISVINFSFAQKVSVDKITESRSTGDSYFWNRTDVELKISGDEVRKYKKARVGKLTKAVDDQGLDLIPEELEARYEDIDNTARVKVYLQNASRKAEVIKELSGEIVLFQPTEQNGAIVKVKDFEKKAGQNLTPTLKDLSVVYMTKDAFEKIKTEKEQKKEAELAKLPEAQRKLAEGILSLFDGFFGNENDKQQAVFFVTGDLNKLVDVSFLNALGEEIKNNGRMTSGEMITYYMNEEIQSNWTLVLNVEFEKATKVVPFKIIDIDLP